MYWAAFHPREAVDALGKVTTALTSIEFSQVFSGIGSAMRSATFDVLKEGLGFNTYNYGTDNYRSFQMGFLQGYVAGYTIEQALLLGKVFDVIKGINVVKQAGKAVEATFEAFTKIADKFGTDVASVLKKFTTPVLKWTSEEARTFAARASKLYSGTDNWLQSLGSGAEQVAAKGERVYQRVMPKFGAAEADKAFTRMFNSNYGKRGLETFDEGPMQQLVEVYQKGNDRIGEMVERFATNLENKGYSFRDSMSYMDDIKDIPGAENLRYNTISANNLGYFFETKRASILKKQTNTNLVELGRKERIEFNFDGQILSEDLEMDVLYDFTFSGNTKRIMEEVKSSSDGIIKLGTGEQRQRQLKQLYKMAEGTRRGFAQEARLVSPAGQLFDAEYRNFAEQLGIIVVEGVA